jgi:hypothetical protein
MNNIAATIVAMGINNPTPTVACHGAAVTPRPTGSAELVSDDLPLFHWLDDARIS